MALFHIVWTIGLLVVFLAIVAWAWNRRRKGAFDAAARLPLEDERSSGTRSAAEGDGDER